MKDGWRTVTIGKLCDEGGGSVQTGPFGSQLHASDYVVDGIPFIMPANLGENKVIENDIARISNADYQRLAKYQLKQGDIIYGRRGDIGRRALITKREEGWMLGSGCLRIRFGDADVDPRYVSYYLGLPEVKQQVLGKAVGTTMPNLNSAIIRSVPLTLPPLPIQRRIASILGALDDKIECNRRINQTLEQMAQALYKHWFVDFAPFRGEGMVESELGEIPRGWRVGKISDVCEFVYGDGLKESARIKGDFPVYGSAGIIGTHNKALVQAPGIIIGRKGTIGKVHWSRLPFFPIDTTFYVRPTLPRYSFEYLYLLLRNQRLEERNNDSAVPGLNRNDAYRIQIPVPSENSLNDFTRKISPLIQQRDMLNSENESLSRTRDYLLPKLMSGEIEIMDAEKVRESD